MIQVLAVVFAVLVTCNVVLMVMLLRLLQRNDEWLEEEQAEHELRTYLLGEATYSTQFLAEKENDA